MHIAICIWGILRSLTYTIPSIREFCLNPITNHGHTYEIFLHTYNFSGDYKNLRNHEKSVKLNFSEWKLLNPDHVYIENQDKFDANVGFTNYMSKGDPWNNNFTSFKNHLRALNSLKQLAVAVETIGKTTHFDGVIYLRPDVTYISELPIYLLEKYTNTLFLANFHRSCKGGEYNDRMAMGDYKSGLIYGKKFDAALSYSLAHQLHSEKFTHDFIAHNGVRVMEMPFRFRRTRASGDIHIRDKALYTPSQQNELVKHNSVPHKTNYFLRCVYAAVETLTVGQMYVWNQDDDENQFCTPHNHVTYAQLNSYRKASLKRVAASNKNGAVLQLRGPNINRTYTNDADAVPLTPHQQQLQLVTVKDVIVKGDSVAVHKNNNAHHHHLEGGAGEHHHHRNNMTTGGVNGIGGGGGRLRGAGGGGRKGRLAAGGGGGVEQQ